MLDKLYRPVKGVRTKDWRLTQKWGANFKVNGKWMYGDIVKGRPYHMGLDYAGPVAGQSVPVYSCHKGTVMVLNDANGFGKYIVIEDDGYSTYYAHLDSISVKSGDWVKIHDPIGIMGSSGNSTAVHLHFGLKINGERVDPTSYIVDWLTGPPERQILVDDGLFSGNIEGMTFERMMQVLARVYSKLKK